MFHEPESSIIILKSQNLFNLHTLKLAQDIETAARLKCKMFLNTYPYIVEIVTAMDLKPHICCTFRWFLIWHVCSHGSHFCLMQMRLRPETTHEPTAEWGWKAAGWSRLVKEAGKWMHRLLEENGFQLLWRIRKYSCTCHMGYMAMDT